MRETRNTDTLLIEETTCEIRHRRNDEIKICHREVYCEDVYFIELILNRIIWAYVNIMMNLQVSATGNILTS
jgi:hypothetical protein